MIKFEDYLIFLGAKHNETITRWRQGGGVPSLESMLDRALEQETMSDTFQDLMQEEKETVLTYIKRIYMENMKPVAGRFHEITQEMCETYVKKNHDYGNSFGESIDKYGYVAGLVRISDKWNRLNSLLMSGDEAQVKDESIIDTITDMASYLVMLRMEFEKRGGGA